MVDAVLYALREILEDYPEAIIYGQDIGRRLGGVFRETATLAAQFGDERVFNTAIQEAYIDRVNSRHVCYGFKTHRRDSVR